MLDGDKAKAVLEKKLEAKAAPEFVAPAPAAAAAAAEPAAAVAVAGVCF